jgi:sortase A
MSRSALRALSTVLIVAGALLLADAALTLTWQEPITALYARLRQDSLAGDLRALQRAAPSELEMRALQGLPSDQGRVAFLARVLKRRATDGSAVGRIRIPSLHANFVVVAGTSTDALRNGPGIYSETPFPGAPGTVAIAGHRTTYLAPFRHIDSLRRGDEIDVQMPYARFTYSVQGQRIVDPSDIGVIRPVGYERLVLSACHPLYSASHRIVVFARLVDTVPLGIARVA